MAWRYRVRLIWPISVLRAIGFALLIPRLFGSSIDQLVRFDPSGGRVIPMQVDTWTLVLMAFALLGQPLAGCLASPDVHLRLTVSVSYDLRNLLYDKLQHLSFAFHDREHTGNLMSKATADVEQCDASSASAWSDPGCAIRLLAITGILAS
jgi:ATP-binding cassette subfamily B protein